MWCSLVAKIASTVTVLCACFDLSVLRQQARHLKFPLVQFANGFGVAIRVVPFGSCTTIVAHPPLDESHLSSGGYGDQLYIYRILFLVQVVKPCNHLYKYINWRMFWHSLMKLYVWWIKDWSHIFAIAWGYDCIRTTPLKDHLECEPPCGIEFKKTATGLFQCPGSSKRSAQQHQGARPGKWGNQDSLIPSRHFMFLRMILIPRSIHFGKQTHVKSFYGWSSPVTCLL